MRLVNVVVGIPVMILGAGSLWLGLNIAFDRSRDSDPGTLYAIGGLFAIIGVILLCAAVAVMVQALDYVLPRWLAVAVGVLGLLPFPVLMGPPSIVFNLLLLGVALMLLLARGAGLRGKHHDPGSAPPLE